MRQNGKGVYALQIIRFFYDKKDTAAYISLLDLQRVMQRAFKRSKLPVWYTKGFNPHIYMTFTAPLSLGQQSIAESLDIKTECENFDWSTAPSLINACLPKGIYVKSAKPPIKKASEIEFAEYNLTYSSYMAERAKNAISYFLNCTQALIEKRGKKNTLKTVNLKENVEIISQSTNENESFTVKIKLPCTNKLNINPMLFLEFLQNETDLEKNSADILRVAMYVTSGEIYE